MPTPPESMEAAPSAENGNIPVETPSETKPSSEQNESVPAKPVESPEGTLYELPDGRKVDAETLAKEFKENFLPDYTRKSQKLSEYEKGGPKDQNITKPTAKDSPFSNPDYVPKNYQEIIDAAKADAKREIREEREQEAKEAAELEEKVSQQITDLKKADPSLDENKLYLHAVKYQFRDLAAAYQNMKDMNLVVKNTQQTTAKNVQKRLDPVSTTGGKPTGGAPDPKNFGSAKDFLRSLNK